MQEKTVKAIKDATDFITAEIGKVIIGKDDVVRKVLMSILARGHVLIDDVPGVGKTSISVALGKVLGMNYNRIQFTPDVLPSDIVGFSIFNRESEHLVYVPGVINDTNLLLADEINRTSSRTQAALLEAMEEKQVTTRDEQFILVPVETLVICINTLKLIHPTDFEGMDHLVAVVRELQVAIQRGMQEGNKPEEVKLEVIQPGDQTEE